MKKKIILEINRISKINIFLNQGKYNNYENLIF